MEKLHSVLIVYDQNPEEINFFFTELNDEYFDLAKDVDGCYINLDEDEETENKKEKFYSKIIANEDGSFRIKELDTPFAIPPNTTLIKFGFLL